MAAAKMSENNGDETRREEEEEKRDESSEMNFMQRFHASRGFSDTPLCGLAYAKDSFNFYKKNKLRLKNEILSGLTVSIAQVPESVAFSFVARAVMAFSLASSPSVGTRRQHSEQ